MFLFKSKKRQSPDESGFMQHFPVKTIEYSYLVRKDGKYIAVCEVSPINMSLLEPEESEHAVEALQEALNTSPERLQILVSSERLNLDDYLHYLERFMQSSQTANQIERIESMIDFIKQRAFQSQKVLRFYLVVQSQFEKEAPALSELADLEKQLRDSLSKQSLFLKRLERKDILELLYQKLNPNTSLYEPLGKDARLSDLQPSLYDATRPFYYILDEKYCKSFTLTAFPTKQNNAGWLADLYNLPIDMDISMSLAATDKEEVLKSYNRSIRNLRNAEKENKNDHAAQKRIQRQQEDADFVLEQLTNENEMLYRTTFVLTVRADSLEDLKNQEKTLRTRIHSKKMASRPLTRWAQQPLWYTLPIAYTGVMEKKVYYNLPSESLASMQPFNSSSLSANDGFVVGENIQSHDLVILALTTRLAYPHRCVLGETGSGKSYYLFGDILRHLDQGEVVIDIDPERERKSIPGNHVYFGLNHKRTLNPFHIRAAIIDSDQEDVELSTPGDYLRTKIDRLQSFFKWILPSMTKLEEASLQKAMIETYERFSQFTFASNTLPTIFPTLTDFVSVLKSMPNTENMLIALSPYYGEGTYGRMFDGQTNWDFVTTKHIQRSDGSTYLKQDPYLYTRLDIYEMPEAAQPVLMDLLVQDVWEFVKSDRDQTKNVYVDEAHIVSDPKNPQTLKLLHQMVKRGRKYSCYLTTATQNVGDFLQKTSEESVPMGQAILTNSGIKILLRLNKKEIQEISEYTPLSSKEKKILEGSKNPKETQGQGIIISVLSTRTCTPS